MAALAQMTPTQWLLLDNLIHGWIYRCNMTRRDADVALRWAEANGLARDGKITPEGIGYFAIHGHEKPKEL